MTSLENLRNNLQSFNALQIIREILKRKDVQELVVKLIQKRLYDKGIDSSGEKFRTDFGRSDRLKGKKGAYSRNTEIIKRASGLPDDRVTFFQTGEFYKSFKTEFKTNGLSVNANFRNIYDNFQDSFTSEREFESAILDITEDEKQQVFEFMLPLIVQEVNKWLAIA